MEVRKFGSVYIAMYRTGLTYATARTFWGAVELALTRAHERADRPARLVARSVGRRVPVVPLYDRPVVTVGSVA